MSEPTTGPETLLSVRDLPAEVRALKVSLVDRRGQRSHVATRWLPGRG